MKFNELDSIEAPLGALWSTAPQCRVKRLRTFVAYYSDVKGSVYKLLDVLLECRPLHLIIDVDPKAFYEDVYFPLVRRTLATRCLSTYRPAYGSASND